MVEDPGLLLATKIYNPNRTPYTLYYGAGPRRAVGD